MRSRILTRVRMLVPGYRLDISASGTGCEEPNSEPYWTTGLCRTASIGPDMTLLHAVILDLESSVVSPGSLRSAPGWLQARGDKSNMFLPGLKPMVFETMQ